MKPGVNNPELSEFEHQTALFKLYNARDANPLHKMRCQEEWGYALLMGFIESGMHEDFVNMALDVCSFYLDPIYGHAIKNMVAQITGDSTLTLDSELLNEMMKKSTLNQETNPTSVVETTSHAIQEYIVFTMGLLISSTFAKGGNECTKYHKFWCLIFIGMQEEIRENIRNCQRGQKYQDESRRGEVERRLENLFKYCITSSIGILNMPFNQHNSESICDSFLLGAAKSYEGFI